MGSELNQSGGRFREVDLGMDRSRLTGPGALPWGLKLIGS